MARLSNVLKAIGWGLGHCKPSDRKISHLIAKSGSGDTVEGKRGALPQQSNLHLMSTLSYPKRGTGLATKVRLDCAPTAQSSNHQAI